MPGWTQAHTAHRESDTQDQTVSDAEKLQEVKKVTSRVEGKLTVAGRKVLQETVTVVDFRRMSVIDDTIEVDDKKKTEEDALRRVDLSDKIGKITQEMRTRTSRNVAALRSIMTPNHDRSRGKVIKINKGTTRKLSNVRQLRNLFEPSPTRGPTEMQAD